MILVELDNVGHNGIEKNSDVSRSYHQYHILYILYSNIWDSQTPNLEENQSKYPIAEILKKN